MPLIPMVVEQESGGERSYDIYSKLLFLEQIENDKNNYKELYLSFIKAFRNIEKKVFKEAINQQKYIKKIFSKNK